MKILTRMPRVSCVRSVLLSGSIAMLTASSGCAAPGTSGEGLTWKESCAANFVKRQDTSWKMPVPNAAGFVMILPGMAGDQLSPSPSTSLAPELNSRQLTVEVWDWRQMYGASPLGNDRMTARNRKRGRYLAEHIRRISGTHGKVYLVAGSGGGTVALAACEARDDQGKAVIANNMIERVIFLSSSLDRGCDLSDVHRVTKSGVFSYSSLLDELLTKERPRSAGVHAFDDPVVYQLDYIREFEKLGNYGDHLECYNSPFSRNVIAPLFDGAGSVPPLWSQRKP